VLRQNLSSAIRFLRRRAGWRQVDLAAHAGASREMVSRIERGRIEGLTLGSLDTIAATLGGSLYVEVRWRGEQLDRLMDAAHAAVQEMVVRHLREVSWLSEVEVSFNWYGDRGRVDAVAFHSDTRTLLVVEVKVRFGDIQDTLGKLDVKTRLGRQLARQLGWPEPARVIPCLVVADGSHRPPNGGRAPSAVARFNLRGRAVRRWLAAPTDEPVTGFWSSKRCQIHVQRPLANGSALRKRRMHTRCESDGSKLPCGHLV
jgi:transcriptional regulator with XRE-family HTH domain